MHSPIARAMTGLGLAALLSGCIPKEKVDAVAPCTEESLISTVRWSFLSQGGTERKYFTVFTREVDGGSPSILLDTLSADTVYDVNVDVWSTTCGQGRNITPVIEAEGDLHQFFYLADGVDISIAYNDTDVNGLPIGVATVWTANTISSGGLRIVLRNAPDKNAAGVSDGDISNAGGETDIEVFFPLVIE